MISFRFGTKFISSDIVRGSFWEPRVSKGSERDLVRTMEWVEGYEADDLSVFKKFLFIGQRFVMLLLIVATKIDLGFVPFFNIMSRHREIMPRQKFAINCKLEQFFVATDHELSRHKFLMLQLIYVAT